MIIHTLSRRAPWQRAHCLALGLTSRGWVTPSLLDQCFRRWLLELRGVIGRTHCPGFDAAVKERNIHTRPTAWPRQAWPRGRGLTERKLEDRCSDPRSLHKLLLRAGQWRDRGRGRLLQRDCFGWVWLW